MKACEVKIFGQTFTLRTEMAESEVRDLAGLVDQRMRDVATASPSASALQVAILAALDLAGERTAEKVEDTGPKVLSTVEERAVSMLRMLDAVAVDQ